MIAMRGNSPHERSSEGIARLDGRFEYMAQYQLKVNRSPLDVGWSAKLIAQFQPIADCEQESFWVRVDSIRENGGGVKYLGLVEDYLTYTSSHGLTMGFRIEFGPENICEVRAPGESSPT